MPTTGGQLIVKGLVAQGVRRVYCVPGESYLPVLDALRDSPIRVIVCRHESGATMMAEAEAKLSGDIGVAMVTRAPGAANAMAGMFIARHDCTPLLLLVGQVKRDTRGRDAFQEMNTARFFADTAKWATDIDAAERVPEMLARACRCALSGRAGAVALGLPEDMLSETTTAKPMRRVAAAVAGPTAAQMQTLRQLLKTAKRPLAILGGGGWSDSAVNHFRSFAEQFNLPVVCSFRRQSLFKHAHDNYAGDLGIGCNPALLKRIKQTDCLLLCGGRLSDIPSQNYTLLDIPFHRQTLIHSHPDANELGRVYHPTLGICATTDEFTRALATLTPPKRCAWTQHTKTARAAYLKWSALPKKTPTHEEAMMRAIMDALRQHAPADAILTNGAGNYAGWAHRYWRYAGHRTQIASTCGTMGYGLPAAIAAKLAHPKATVVCFAGDGCLQMTVQELATAAQEQAAIIVIVADNAMHGTIRMHQQRLFPGREIATALTNPDFAAIARACRFHAETVRLPIDCAPALQRALAVKKPALIHLRLTESNHRT